MAVSQTARNRGSAARRPAQIPGRGWRDILTRVKDQIAADNVSLIAAGVAFYAMLAIFPALSALVSIYGLVMDPASVESQVQQLGTILPSAAQSIIEQQLTSVAAQPQGAIGLVAIGSLLLALWSATKGTKAMMTALGIVYKADEERGFLKFNGLALLLTVCAVVAAVVTLALIVVVPALLGTVGLGDTAQWLVSVLRWPVLLIVVMLGLAVLYRYGPCRRVARWEWATWGATAAVLLWIAASVLFSWYVSNFGSYNETYGSLGAVVILLLWFYLSAYVFLLGAEVNAEMEHHTRHDTTIGPEKPMGERGAYHADHVAGRS